MLAPLRLSLVALCLLCLRQSAYAQLVTLVDGAGDQILATINPAGQTSLISTILTATAVGAGPAVVGASPTPNGPAPPTVYAATNARGQTVSMTFTPTTPVTQTPPNVPSGTIATTVVSAQSLATAGKSDALTLRPLQALGAVAITGAGLVLGAAWIA